MKSVNFEETKIWNLTFDFQWRIRLPGFHANANRLKNQSFIQLVQGRRIFIFTNSGLTPLLNYPKTGHMTQVHIFSQEQLSVYKKEEGQVLNQSQSWRFSLFPLPHHDKLMY